MIPLHYSAIYKGDGELALNRQSSGLLVANSARAMLAPDRSEARLEPILQESKSCVLTSCTTPYYISRKGETRTHDRLLIRQEFLPAELPSYIVGRIGFEPIPRGASIHRSTIGAIFPRKNHLPLSDKWSNSAKHSITAYTAHNPHNLIKTRQIIQFLILHQN